MRQLIVPLVVGLSFIATNCSLNTEGTAMFEQTGGSPDASVGGAGSGGAGVGGTTGKGGAAGTTSSGGAAGVAGNPSGGAAGQAGAAGSGGVGEGGTSGTGGTTSTGGTTGEGGATGTGGTTGEGGATGTGGTGTGGATGMGGSTGEGGSAGNDAAVCNLTSLPAPTLFPLSTHVTNVRINGGGAVANDVAPGSQLAVLYDFQIQNSNPCDCPTCVQQIYVGFAGVMINQCTSLLRGCPGNSGTNKSVALIAPTQPGTYYLSVASTWEYNCVDATPDPNPGAWVGAICVK